MSTKSISIIIPVYNEENYIEQVIERVLAADTLGLKKEVIVVDDGSTDSTMKKITNYKLPASPAGRRITNKKQVDFKILYKKKNEGKGAAIRAAVLVSRSDIVLIQDADLEYDPADYPILLEPFLKYNADVVYGSRFMGNRPHRILYFWHYVGNIILTNLSNMLTNLNLTDMETGYKVFRGTVIRSIAPHLRSNRFGFEPEVTARIAQVKNIKIYEVGISYSGRTYEEGKKIGWYDGIRAFVDILRFNLFK